MTYEPDCTLPTDLLEQISAQGFDFLPELIRILVNAAMQVEHQKHLAAGLYERSTERQGHANGYKPKTVKTRMVPTLSSAGEYCFFTWSAELYSHWVTNCPPPGERIFTFVIETMKIC
jgi:hypothetical protein